MKIVYFLVLLFYIFLSYPCQQTDKIKDIFCTLIHISLTELLYFGWNIDLLLSWKTFLNTFYSS